MNTARDLAMHFEGCDLTAYPDPLSPGVWSIGYGHCGPEVHEGLVWTQSQADNELDADLNEAKHMLMIYSPNIINPGAIEALTDFVFNLGSGRYRNSTLRLYVNGANWPMAKTELLKWDHSNGVVVPGLTRRRQAEAALI